MLAPLILTRGDSLPELKGWEEIQSGRHQQKSFREKAVEEKQDPAISLKFRVPRLFLGGFACVVIESHPRCFAPNFVGSKSQVMPRHQVAEACETEHSKGGPMRFSSGNLGWKWEVHGTKKTWGWQFSSLPPLFNLNAFFVMWPKLNEFVNPVKIYEGSIILSHPWATIPPPRVLPTPSTLQPKSPLSAGKGSLLWIGTKAKELGCKLKWPGWLAPLKSMCDPGKKTLCKFVATVSHFTLPKHLQRSNVPQFSNACDKKI